MSILAAIQAEIEPLQQRLDKLRALQQQARELDDEGGGGAGEHAPSHGVPESAGASPAARTAPPATARAPRNGRPSTRDAEAKILGALLKANRWLTGPQITEASGVTEHTRKELLQRLVADGRVQADGTGRGRKYRRAQQDGFHTQERTAMEASKAKNAQKETSAIKRVGLREKVLRAIAADANKLTVPALAQVLAAHPDDVSEACDHLVQQDKVQRNEDGTYRRTAKDAG